MDGQQGREEFLIGEGVFTRVSEGVGCDGSVEFLSHIYIK